MPVIRNSFQIDKPAQLVWASFRDVHLVADCMPGVEFGQQLSEQSFTGKLTTKIGAISASFEGQAEITEEDNEQRQGTISAKGIDRRGGSRASATIQYKVTGADGSSTVEVEADIRIQGTLAQFGRSGILQDVSDQLIKDFAETLQRRLSVKSPDEAKEIRAGEVRPFKLVLAGLLARIRRFFRTKRT